MGTRDQFSADTMMCREFNSCPWNQTDQAECTFLLSTTVTTTPPTAAASNYTSSPIKPWSTTKRVLIGIMVTTVLVIFIVGFSVVW
jgi:hypothetical protein